MRLTFLTPRLPPAVCGLADHTQRLAEAMVKRSVEIGFIHTERRRTTPAPLQGPVDCWNGDPRSLTVLLVRHRADWLWVQLSGYGYSRWGAPFRLGQAISRARKSIPGLRVAVFVHETYCSAGSLGFKAPLLVPWQRFTVKRMARLADVVFSSNPKQWKQLVSECGIREKAFLLPIGPNVPALTLTVAERARMRDGFGWKPGEIVAVAFGSWNMQMLACKRHNECLAKAMELGALHRLACVGGDSPEAPAQLREYARVGPLAGKLTIFGRRDAAEVARILCCCDVGLVEPPRPMICKSGGFVAMATNGLPVITAGRGDPGYGLDSLEGCMTSERILSGACSQAQLATWGDALRRLALKTFDWNAIAAQALSRLCCGGPGTGDGNGDKASIP